MNVFLQKKLYFACRYNVESLCIRMWSIDKVIKRCIHTSAAASTCNTRRYVFI